MAEFAYNNVQNINNSNTALKLNYSYHTYVFFEEKTIPRSQSKTADKLSAKLWELMTVC